MSRVRTKPGVVFGGFTPSLCQILTAICDVAGTWQGLPEDVVITSASDGTHHPRSKHYTFQALDLRTKNFPPGGALPRFIATLRERLGPQFTVIHEGVGTDQEHLHIQLRKSLAVWEPEPAPVSE